MCLLPWCINFTSTGRVTRDIGLLVCILPDRPDLDHTLVRGFHARTVNQVPGLGSVVREASSALRDKGGTYRVRPCFAKLTSAVQDLLDALARFSYFDRWSDEQRRDCCHRAQIRQFEPDQTVFVEGQAPVNYAHFMLSGECGLLQCLKLHRRRDRRTGAKRYRLSRAQPTEDEITRFHRRRQQATDASRAEVHNAASTTTQQTPATVRRAPTKIEYHFVDIATYSRGSVFGIGEHMVDRAVFARTHVQCLLIPRYWLLEKPQNRGNIWNRIRIFLEQRQPSRERLFRWFLAELLWHRYRKQLVDDFLLVHAPRHLPGLIDVPLACRIEECDVQTETD